MKKLLFVLSVMWVGGAAGVWYWNDARPRRVEYRTVHVNRGDLLASITSTGTLEPEEVVDVGAQIAGEILSFGKDPKDPSRAVSHGSPVEQGTVLARLDDKVYTARVNQAKAGVIKAEADVEQAEVKVRQTQRELERVQKLYKARTISAQEYDLASFEAEAARAALLVMKSALEVTKANLEEASVNLGYTTIKSPVKGVIVDRRVNIGQTVVASLNAPSLFLIAKDLSRMEIWASVNETDVGQIHPGQNVRFTVSAFPADTFTGTVKQIRLNASMSQSVVTYTVVVEVENRTGKLLPYLTARLQFEVAERRQVLVVPNSALRWLPSKEHVAPAFRDGSSESLKRRSRVGADPTRPKTDKGYENRGTLWVRDDQFVRPIDVNVGLTDGLTTEIHGAELREGAEVVVGLVQATDD
ncbi:MAG: efflux RND transporter periplasmic adaptor subunit, partial [Planctomycetia bacterium]|nr:efflux RND transporter periplasmic adaptor subunit [Planctomycetia bacterium]